LEEENEYLTGEYQKLLRNHAGTEQQLIEAKLAWANLDMENDELTIQAKQRVDMIKMYQMRITSMEIDLARARDQIDS